MTLTVEQTAAITSTWGAIAGNEETVGKDMFVKLFTDHPELKGNFKYPDEDLGALDAQLKMHGKKVIGGIGTIVAAIGNPDPAITSIGETHKVKNLGATDALFAPLGEALMHALSVHIGRAWNADVQSAYGVLYEHLHVAMMAAVN